MPAAGHDVGFVGDFLELFLLFTKFFFQCWNLVWRKSYLKLVFQKKAHYACEIDRFEEHAHYECEMDEFEENVVNSSFKKLKWKFPKIMRNIFLA